MLVEQLVKRTARERYALGMIVVVLAVVACYTAGISPALNAADGHKENLNTTEKVLLLQQTQLNLLRAETKVSQQTLDRLKDLPCPWVQADRADVVLQEIQKEAEGLGLSVHSVAREAVTGLRLKDAPRPVLQLLVRLELDGPYASVMEMFRRLSKGNLTIGLEELSLEGSDAPPHDVAVVLRVRLPVVEGDNHG
ncbi:MAG TPA: type II secretion system protein GspM [Phycisphaerae bacterium]|nr:type II secretion system protein GspM [Phycisphaerae bacterium]